MKYLLFILALLLSGCSFYPVYSAPTYRGYNYTTLTWVTWLEQDNTKLIYSNTGYRK